MNAPSGSLDSLTAPGLARLIASARRALELNGADLNAGIGVTNPSDDERKAISGLIGRPVKPHTKRIQVKLAELDARIRDRTGSGLIDALTTLTRQPLRNRPQDLTRQATARAALLALAHASPLHHCSWFASWIDVLQADGTFTRLLDAPGRFAHAIRVLELIGDSPILLPKLAARATGDSHALDTGTPLSTLVLTALAARADTPAPKTAEERRDLWDRFNVVVDDLASKVLVLNLPAHGEGLGEWLTGAARYATPLHVTLHQLLRHPIHLAPPHIYVCENPAVLREAADVLGPSCPPVLCTEGQPSTAFHRLATQITDNGGRLHYHGDFDWPGISIANAVITRHRALPWRMTADDYLAGLAHDAQPAKELAGKPQPTPWDPLLHDTMTDRGRPVFEEAVVDRLLGDLA